MRVPRIIHQTWKDDRVPEHWRGFQASWQRQHPDWSYRLWTDAQCRELVAAQAPWFLTLYDGYPEPVMRVDAFRYFLMDRVGGVYVDLDFECLRPVDELLADHALVLGLEPDAHVEKLLARERGLARIVGNAFLASVAGHPFWRHVIEQLVARHREPGVLDATGPFLLTAAVESFPGTPGPRLVPPGALYPAAAPDARAGNGGEVPDPIHEGAFAVHHWSGSWVRDTQWSPRAVEACGIPYRVTDRIRPVADGVLDLHACTELWDGDPEPPLVSCLMVTAGRPMLAWRAIRCFVAQTWAARELVIVDDDPDPDLHRQVAALGDPRIRHLRPEPRRATLGELRNLALASARGELVMQWDDDDLYDPRRIEAQVAALEALAADVCVLRRETLWWPGARRLATSGPRPWEGSMLARRAAAGCYPEQRRGEDTALLTRLLRAGRAVVLDAPWLYVYVFHGANTFDADHFEALFAAAETVEEGSDYVQALIALAARLPIELDAELERPGRPRRTAAGEARKDSPGPVPVAPTRVPATRGEDPASGLVLTPVKNASRFLERYVENLLGLDHDPARLSLGMLESDSSDDTWSRVEEVRDALAGRLARVTVVKRDFGYRLDGPRQAVEHQRARRAVLARSRNALLSAALRDERWVLWLDVDVTAYPPDLTGQLIAAGKPVVAAHCVTRPGGPTFDLNTFVLREDAEGIDWSRHVIDGILQPPRGLGRRYLDELRDRALVAVDGVGGTALLVDADLHREGLVFPAYPHALHIETEGLAEMARDLGIRCWALPGLEVVHPPDG